MALQYAYTILYVTDVSASIDFYERAFGFRRRFITPEQDYGELESGATTIAFASNELAQSNFSQPINTANNPNKPFGIELALTSNDIASDYQRAIEAGATCFAPLTDKPWGQTVGYVLDNNHYLIELCTPMSQ